MQTPATPINEALRLKTLHALGILDTVPDAAFDRYTQLAAARLNMPIALVSLVDRDRQWFKSRHGLDGTETPRDISFCGHAILGEEVCVVRDASLDIRFQDNPLVTGAPGIRFYAGRPLRAPNGQRLGTLCVIDRKPREFSPTDRQALAEIGGKVERELARLTHATTDPLTRLANGPGFDSMLRHSLAWCRRQGQQGCLGVVRVACIGEFARSYGQGAAEAVLRQFSDQFASVFQRSDILAHHRPGEFRFFTPGRGEEPALDVLERLAALISGSVRGMLGPDPVWHAGTVDISQAPKADLADLVARATERLESCLSLQRTLQREL
ncbi:MAG: hypothetical protein RLZZ200_1166, partial [Pseudomonadota bacterium]